ncbi:TPA: hypothetical protein ACH3X1_014413 [Trebouxia sp. C0004]
MELHASINPRCSLTFVKQRPEQQLKLRSRSTRPHCPGSSRLQIVSKRARSVPEHSDPQLAQRLQESASTSAESTRSSQEPKEQQTHFGIAPDRPQAPEPPRLTRLVTLGLGLAAFSAFLLGVFEFQRQRKEKKQRQQSPAPAPEWQSRPPVIASRSSNNRSRPKERTKAKDGHKASKQIICRNFAATGTCRFGDRCRYKHVSVPQEGRDKVLMRSSAPESMEDASDSANESDSDDSSADPLARSSRPSASKAASSDTRNQQSRKKAPNIYQTLHKVYTVAGIGKLMGFKGKNINHITNTTGCCIIISRGRVENEPVPIDIWAENHLDLSEAVKMISACFEEE